MKKAIVILFAIMTVSNTSSHVWASTVSDVVNIFYTSQRIAITNPYLSENLLNTVYYQHNILDDGFEIGDTLNYATITFNIYGADGYGGDSIGSWWIFTWDYTEDIDLLADGQIVTTNFELDNGSEITLAGTILAALEHDGILNMRLEVTDGDFILRSSTLEADYTPQTVPIPGTLLMLGTGLIGLLGIRRRFAAN